VFKVTTNNPKIQDMTSKGSDSPLEGLCTSQGHSGKGRGCWINDTLDIGRYYLISSRGVSRLLMSCRRAKWWCGAFSGVWCDVVC
jgi:hypothetical protein